MLDSTTATKMDDSIVNEDFDNDTPNDDESYSDDYTPEVAGLSVFDIAAIEGIDLSDYLRDHE